MSRQLATAACLALVAWCVGYYVWAEAPALMDARTESQYHARVVPWELLPRLVQQLQDTELFQNADPVRSLVHVLLFAGWLFGVTFCGHAVIRRLVDGWLHPAERLAFSFLAGTVIVGTGTALLGMAGGITGYAGRGLLGALLLGVAGVEAWRVRKAIRWPALTVLQVVGIVLLAVLFLNCCTPPIQSDAMRYHLSAPQEWLKMGRIGYLPLNAFSNFPMLIEVHALLVGMTGLQMVHFAIMIATGLAIYGLSVRLQDCFGMAESRVLPTIAALLYMFIPAGAVVATWPNIDHATSLCVLLSTLALVMVMQKSTRGHYALLGITAGAALSVKYTLLAHLGLLFIAWSAWLLARKPRGTINSVGLDGDRSTNTCTIGTRCQCNVAGAATALVVLLLIASPWYLKNIVYTGNPVYPLANGLFGSGGEWTGECADLYAAQASRKGEAKTVGNLPLSVWRSTFEWIKYESHNPGAATGICWIVLVAGAIGWVRRRAAEITLIIYLAVGTWLVWFFTYQSNRMLLPFFALVLPLVPMVIAPFAAKLRHVTTGVLCAGAFAGGLWALQWMYAFTALSPPPLPFLLGGMPADVYMAKSLNYWQAYQSLNSRVRDGERVLLVGEHRIYGAKFDAVWSDWYDTPAVAHWMRTRSIRSVDELLDSLRREKVRWVLINEPELRPQMPLFRPRFSDAEWQILTELRTITDARVERREIPPGLTLLRFVDPAR